MKKRFANWFSEKGKCMLASPLPISKEFLQEYPDSSKGQPASERMSLFPESNALSYDRRTIILAPTGKDDYLIMSLLEKAGLPSQIVNSVEELCDEIANGAG